MNCIIITRASRPGNIKSVKDSVRQTFSGSKHTYRHVLVCDFTDAYSDISDYEPFIGKHTSLFPVCMKNANDKYMTEGIDRALDNVADTEGYVYVLDDDNVMMPEFLTALDAAEKKNPPAVVFRLRNKPQWGSPTIQPGEAVGKIDFANYIVRLDVIRELKVYCPFSDSHDADGELFNDILHHYDGEIEYLDSVCGVYNGLKG